jgi:hypothetical protein
MTSAFGAQAFEAPVLESAGSFEPTFSTSTKLR